MNNLKEKLNSNREMLKNKEYFKLIKIKNEIKSVHILLTQILILYPLITIAGFIYREFIDQEVYLRIFLILSGMTVFSFCSIIIAAYLSSKDKYKFYQKNKHKLENPYALSKQELEDLILFEELNSTLGKERLNVLLSKARKNTEKDIMDIDFVLFFYELVEEDIEEIISLEEERSIILKQMK